MSTDATVPYAGQRSMRNATVNDPALVAGIAKQKEYTADAVRQYVKEGRRQNKPGSKRTIKHILPMEETYTPEGPVSKRPTTQTRRKSN